MFAFILVDLYFPHLEPGIIIILKYDGRIVADDLKGP